MNKRTDSELTHIAISEPIWDRFFSVHPLVLVGSREPAGNYDIAPKHMAMPLGWNEFYGFVCAPTHGTYKNVRREGVFTVSFPKPSQIILTSLAADPRNEDGTKPALSALATFPAFSVDGVLVKDALLFLECKLHQIIEGLGENCLIIGTIVAAHVDPNALRSVDLDDQELIRQTPILAYLNPGRFAKIDESYSFPFPSGFKH